MPVEVVGGAEGQGAAGDAGRSRLGRADAGHTQSPTSQPSKRFLGPIVAVMVLVLGFLVFDRFILEPRHEAGVADRNGQTAPLETPVIGNQGRSIAVLAFADMSPEGDQEYLSDGESEELINLLAGVPELRVISRTSAFSFKNKDTSNGIQKKEAVEEAAKAMSDIRRSFLQAP